MNGMKRTMFIFLALAHMCVHSSGATVNIGDLPSLRPIVAADGVPLNDAGSYYMTVGGFSGGIVPQIFDSISFFAAMEAFLQFATVSSVAGGRIGGSFVGTGPPSLDGAKEFLLVHTGSTIAETIADAYGSAMFIETQRLFPNPVAGAGSVAVVSSFSTLNVRASSPLTLLGRPLSLVSVTEPTINLMIAGAFLLFLWRKRD
jgi:hypothetical protein